MIVLIIIAQIIIAAFLVLLAGHDSSSIRLRETTTDSLTLKRIKRWHRDGSLIYAVFCIIMALHFGWLLLIPAAILRVALFDPALNYFTDFPISFIGTTATWDKWFVKVFGPHGAVKKLIAAIVLLILLNALYFIL